MTIPTLFQNSLPIYLLCLLILIGGQFIYATVGFGAGMFAVTLLVLLLDDLPGVVMTMLLLTWITEVIVLSREWRHAWGKMLLVIVPPTVIGLWVGTRTLAAGNGEALKFVLGAFVAVAGLYFLWSDIRAAVRDASAPAPNASTIAPRRRVTPRLVALCAPIGLVSGVLGACFGTGGPPVVILFKSLGLDKRAFRATLLGLFITMSVSRITFGITEHILTLDNVHAALWLVPGSVIGTTVGAKVHGHLSEHVFARVVSVLITVLGVTLIVVG